MTTGVRTTIKWLVAALMGFGCSLLISLIMLLFRFDPAGADRPDGPTILLGLVLGWALATWLLLRRAAGVSNVLQRGFLLGAALWIGIAVMIHQLALQIPPGPLADINESKASWEPDVPLTLRGPAGAPVARTGALAFAGACLLGWAVVFAVARDHERRRARGRRPAGPVSARFQVDP